MHYVVVNRSDKVKKRKRILRRFVGILFLVAVLAVVVALSVYRKSMTPTILDIVEVKVQAAATRAVNEAVLKALQSGVDVAEYVTVERNSLGDVVMISANSYAVNTIAHNAALLTQAQLNTLAQTVRIPLGTLSGVPLLSEMGPVVDVTVAPVGASHCSFVSKFESAGINQTLHRIYLTVQGEVELIVPQMHRTLQIDTPILLSETLIVGSVPQTYLQGGLLLGAA